MSSSTRPPNVLLITTDEQRDDTLGVTGNPPLHPGAALRPRTPNIDRLAARGVVFTRGYIQNPVCIPSRACIQTGRYVHQHGVDHMEPVIGTTPGLPPWETTFMERLQQAGYATAAFGKIHMMPPKGFDELQLTMGKGARWTVSGRWREGAGSAEDSPLGPSQLGPVYAAWLECKRPGAYESIYAQRRQPEYRDQATAIVNVLAADEYVDYWIGQNTWEYLDRAHDRPFFLWCGFCGPHPPFDPPEPYASLYDQDAIPVPPLLRARRRTFDGALMPGEDRRSRFDRDDGERLARKMIAYYWGMVMFIDDMVGRIMETLTRRGLWGNTLVVFTTDHGAMLGDFGQTGKGNFAEQVIRVPYIVVPPAAGPTPEDLTPWPPSGNPLAGAGRGNDGRGARTFDGLVEHVDLAPTILDYAGIPHPPELPGVSLRPILEADAVAHSGKEAVVCEHATREGETMVRRQCLRTERYKYVVWSDGRPAELYDLREDPQELVNVAGDPASAGEVQRHAELLLQRRLATETNAWKCGLAARTPPALDYFGRPLHPGS